MRYNPLLDGCRFAVQFGGYIVFSKFEDAILKEYKNKLKTDNSVKNIIKVFIENYLKESKKYNRQEDADMLLFQYGVYDWGNGKNLEIDFVRQLIKDEDIIQIHITLTIPFEEKFSTIESYEEWYNSFENKKTLEEWKNEIETMQIFQQIDSLKYNLEIWKENAE